ncbi:hypothetical protein Q8A73_003061 [Channa argus]|nr:hypothetical protein Q8A73_003061 [Channa argus]
MDFSYILLVVSLVYSLRDFHVSACDVNCKDKPVFTPSRLVVKHGGPMSATCSVCQSGCTDSFGLEKSVGTTSKNGNTIKWTVDKMTEWEPSPFCYYNDPKIPDKQCCTKLPITVYKLPDSVSISIFNHTGSMYEGHQYTLQCEVKNVAPIQNLSVTFYRGNTPLGQLQSVNNPAKKPASDTYSQSITASKEDDGAQYWCEAELELGPEGPHPPPAMKSQNINTTVYYKPRLNVSEKSITITAGNHLQLTCSAVGNPKPSITWTRANSTIAIADSNVLNISPVATTDKGEYICSASNKIATVVVSVKVEVQVNYVPYIIAGTALLIVVVLVLFVVVYMYYYRNYRMGQYNLKDVFQLHKQLIPGPSA